MINFFKKFGLGILVYIREFGYIRVGNKFQPSTKKFWFQAAQLIFVLAVMMKLFGPEHLSARISDALIAILLGHASGAMVAYGLGKPGDVARANSDAPAVTVTAPKGQTEEVIPDEVQ